MRWNLWVVDDNKPLAPGASYDCEVKALCKAGSYVMRHGTQMSNLQVREIDLFGRSALMIKDPDKSWGVATLETTND